MKKDSVTRRDFLQKTTAGTAIGLASPMVLTAAASESLGQPAILGGKPIRKKGFPRWPQIESNDRKAWKKVLEDRGWCRSGGGEVSTFEKKYAALMGSKECLATANGTSALFASLNAIGIEPGDEVLVPPYTFVATINVVLLQHAIPVFVDTDRKTFQMDASKIEEKISERTRGIIPVHLGGNVCDMDAILAVAKKHNLPVIEDACQSHLAEWKGKRVGTMGTTGCFSFQVSKNLSGGEGGAVLTDDSGVMDRCYSFHTNGRARRGSRGFSYVQGGANLRMTEFQGALLQEQMTRIEEQSQTRSENAAYLTAMLSEIPGIHPAQEYPGTTRNAFHLYMFRYDKNEFAGLPRNKFTKALKAEGITCSNGYSPLNKEPFLEKTLRTRGYEAIYSKDYIDRYFAECHCPENDRLCNEEAVWFLQYMLLDKRSAMEDIAAAVRKIHQHAGQIV